MTPKAISGRTSYLRVRLEFLPYPHLIATFFNRCACGPPKPFTVPSSWTWIDHPVSGPRPPTFALLRLGFPADAPLMGLLLAGERDSPDRSTKSTRSRLSLSLPSRGPFHLSLTVLYAIGHWVVFSLGGWSPRIPTRFPVSRGTPDPARPPQFSCTGLSPSPAGCPKTVPLTLDS